VRAWDIQISVGLPCQCANAARRVLRERLAPWRRAVITEVDDLTLQLTVTTDEIPREAAQDVSQYLVAAVQSTLAQHELPDATMSITQFEPAS